MKVVYDAEVDVLRIVFRESPIFESDQITSDVVLDLDVAGQVTALELLNASHHVAEPRLVELALTGRI